ncbi:hypothetical protein [Streptomyces sp. TLI_146]|uniref:hypothetical protein n=1 Tax=Streptomyces sp. TLI_146 TaxID=1938858 RepID=UPI0011804E71|nr:hypothetical protein [Streptomyces sp. TLI_146]
MRNLFYAKVREVLKAPREVDTLGPQRQAQIDIWRRRSGIPDKDERQGGGVKAERGTSTGSSPTMTS